MKTTVPIVTGTPGAITPATPQVKQTKQANTKELPSTGESTRHFGPMGVAMTA